VTKRRVVVTGLGMVSPVGLNVESTWKAILNGQSGVTKIDQFDASDISCQICSSVKGFNSADYMSDKDARKKDIFIQFGIAAAMQAMQDSGLEVSEENADRIGVAVGSGIGGLPFIERSTLLLNEAGPRKISPFFIPSAIINMISGLISIQYNLRGPNRSGYRLHDGRA
jgi:3-oxoacyl-[acyl-carrier-protein] synthase II